MKKRMILYVMISIICIAAIGIAVYYQVFNNSEENPEDFTQNRISNTVGGNIDNSLEKAKEELNSLFVNSLRLQKVDVSYVKKLDETKEIVYPAYNIKEEKDKYNVSINIPVINIEGTVVADFNKITQQIFANKASEVLSSSTEYTIYSVDYIAYVNGNVLSVAIKSSLKQGNDAQRIMVQTYNYDMKTGKKVTLNEILAQKVIETKTVNTKIAAEVKKAKEQAEQLKQATGQSGDFIYNRDLNSAIYITDNVGTFLLGRDGKIYIIYAYGNNNFTSEMDVITVE